MIINREDIVREITSFDMGSNDESYSGESETSITVSGTQTYVNLSHLCVVASRILYVITEKTKSGTRMNFVR